MPAPEFRGGASLRSKCLSRKPNSKKAGILGICGQGVSENGSLRLAPEINSDCAAGDSSVVEWTVPSINSGGGQRRAPPLSLFRHISSARVVTVQGPSKQTRLVRGHHNRRVSAVSVQWPRSVPRWQPAPPSYTEIGETLGTGQTLCTTSGAPISTVGRPKIILVRVVVERCRERPIDFMSAGSTADAILRLGGLCERLLD
jgi:hypothetical protein